MPHFKNEDCKSALVYLYLDELATGGLEKLEFLGTDSKPTSFLRKEPTPRKYTFRKSQRAGILSTISI